MNGLYPTPTRRELLDAIAAHQVQVTAAGHVTRTDTGRRVTAAVDEMVQAHWATRPADAVGPVQLTALGRAVRTVRILDYGTHIVAETGPCAEPTVLGTAHPGAGRWTVTLGGASVGCRSRTVAVGELQHRAVQALTGQEEAQ